MKVDTVCEVLQGSILGPLPVGHITQRLNVRYHTHPISTYLYTALSLRDMEVDVQHVPATEQQDSC